MGVNRDVREGRMEDDGRREGSAVFVEVVVRVDVFDCVDVEVSMIPLKRRLR